MTAAAAGLLLLGEIRDHAVGREQEARDGRRVLEGAARDLRRIDDTGLQEVAVLAGADVVAVRAGRLLDVGDDERGLESGVVDELAERRLDRTGDDVRADLLVTLEVEGLDGLLRTEIGDAAAGDDALFNGRTGGVQGVVDTVLLLLHRSFRRRANLDEGNAAGELGETLLKLLAIIVGRGLLDLLLDLLDAGLDVRSLAETLDDRGVVLVDDDLLRAAEHIDRDGLELDADVLADELAAREDRDVLEDRLPAVTEARRLDGADLERAAKLVHDERRERLALDVLGDDHERTARLRDRLEERQHVLQVRDLLLEEEDERVLELALHRLRVRHEIRGEVALVELHALDDVERALEGLGLLDRDRAFLADLVHRLGDHLADFLVAVRRERRDLRDLIGALHLLGELGDRVRNSCGGLVDAALQRHAVRTGREVLEALAVNRLGEKRRRGRAVARDVVRLRGDFLDHLRTHVLERIGKLDLLGDGNAVLGDLGRAELLVENHVAAGRTERAGDGVRELLDTGENLLTRIGVELNLLSHDLSPN